MSRALVLSLVITAPLVLSASGSRRVTFALPDSMLLFGNYNDLRVVTPDGEQALRPPNDVGFNGGYFASPAISPRGDALAWGFVVRWERGRRSDRPRFALGVYSLPDRKWKTFGDFDWIGTAAYSSAGDRIAFVSREHGRQELMIFNVESETWTKAPYPTGGLRANATMSWAPDDKRLVVEVQRGGVAYSPQLSEEETNRNSIVAVLDVATGNVRSLGEGYDPSWSPDGQWIAYYAPGKTKCMLVHPDGTGRKVAKQFRQSIFSSRSFTWGGPVWSPSSTHLLFTVSADESYVDLMQLDLRTGRSTTQLRKGYPIFGWVRTPGANPD